MTRIGHLKSTTLFPQRIKENTARYEQNTSLRKFCSDEAWENKKDLESASDMAEYEFSASGIVPLKEYKKCKKTAVKCFLCSKLIKSDHLSEHLLFSEVECRKCNAVIKNCQDFQMWLVEKNMGGNVCDHALEYPGGTMEKLKMCLAHGFCNEKSVPTAREIDNLLRKYINRIASLKNLLPWQQVISEFVEFEHSMQWHSQGGNYLVNKKTGSVNQVKLSGVSEVRRTDISRTPQTCLQNSLENATLKGNSKTDILEHIKSKFCVDDSLTHYKVDAGHFKRSKGSSNSKINGSLNKKRKSDYKITEAKQNKRSDYVATPDDGFYYVVRDLVSECPNCYTSLSPVDFSINIVTFLMTAVCSECNLTIYIVQDPPDDSSPCICIVTDQKGKDIKLTKTKKLKPNSLPEQ